MSEATAPRPGADNAWDTIDEAVRDQLGMLLTAGTNLISSSELMGRLDPLSLFQPLAAYRAVSAASRPDKVVGMLTRTAGEMLRATAAATVRARRRHFVVCAEAWQRQAVRRSGVERECRVLVAQGDLSRLGAGAARNRPGRRHAAGGQQKAEFAVQLMVDALAPTNFVRETLR